MERRPSVPPPSPSEVPRPWDRWTPEQRLKFAHIEKEKPRVANGIFVSLKILQNASILLPEMVERRREHLIREGLLPQGYEGEQD